MFPVGLRWKQSPCSSRTDRMNNCVTSSLTLLSVFWWRWNELDQCWMGRAFSSIIIDSASNNPCSFWNLLNNINFPIWNWLEASSKQLSLWGVGYTVIVIAFKEENKENELFPWLQVAFLPLHCKPQGLDVSVSVSLISWCREGAKINQLSKYRRILRRRSPCSREIGSWMYVSFKSRVVNHSPLTIVLPNNGGQNNWWLTSDPYAVPIRVCSPAWLPLMTNLQGGGLLWEVEEFWLWKHCSCTLAELHFPCPGQAGCLRDSLQPDLNLDFILISHFQFIPVSLWIHYQRVFSSTMKLQYSYCHTQVII